MATNSRFAIAVHTLALMAGYKDKPIKSDYIACYVKTNPVVIRRLLPELARADLVETQPGGSGGSRLKRQPEKISLWEIYQAVETEAAFAVHRPLTKSECKVSSNIECVLINVQNRVDKAVWQTLSDVTLADVLQMIIEECGESLDAGECSESKRVK